MATNPYSYGSLGQRWTVGEPTSKSLLDVSRVKADANRWALEQLIVDPDDTANFVLTAPGLNIDSNTLYVDSVYNSVGFRLTNPNDYAFNGTPSWVASGGAGNASVILVSGTTSIGYFAFADGTTGTDRYSGNIQYNHSTNTMSFNTNGGVEAMSIDSSQRVGIGTASPAVPLDVDLAGGANYIAHFRNQTTGTPYGVHIDEPSSATVDYPLLTVGPVATPRFRVFSGANQTDLTDDGLTINAGTSSVGLTVTASSGQVELQTDGQLYGYQKLDVTAAGLQIKGFSDGGGAKTEQARLWLTQAATGARGGEIRFYTDNGSAMYERLRITSTGAIEIPNQNAINELTFTGTDFTNVFSQTTSGMQFGTTGAGSYLALYAANAETARVTTDGITFNGDTAAANALDDYEEGTYSVTDQSGAGLSFTVNSSRYVKIGKLVWIGIEIVFPTTSDTNIVYISLPFAQSTAQRASLSCVTNRSDVTVQGYASTGTARLGIIESAASPVSVTNASLSGKYVIIGGVYEAA